MKYQFDVNDVIRQGKVSEEKFLAIKKWWTSKNLEEIPDEMFVLSLMACEDEIENAKNTIKAYFECKNSAPEIFNYKDIDSTEIKLCLSTVSFAIMPQRTRDNHMVMVMRLNDPSYEKFDFMCHLQMAAMIMDLITNEKPSAAWIAIMDLEKLSLSLLAKFKIGVLRKLFDYVQKGLLVKIHAIHVLNCGYVIKCLMKIIQMCVTNDLLSKIKCHPYGSSLEEFSKNHVPNSCMPEDYGGELPSLEEMADRTIDRIRELKQFFEEEKILRQKIQDQLLENGKCM